MALFPSLSVSSIVLPQQDAGTADPSDADELSEVLARALVTARSSSIENAKLIIAPLSPLNECGAVAASAFANLANRRGTLRRIVVLGPARSMLRGVSIPAVPALSTPFGSLGIDHLALRLLKPFPEVSVDDRGFEAEPSISGILPLLQACLGQFQIVPVLVGSVSPELVSQILAKLWGGPETLVVVTSDLSHGLADERARAFDIETRGLIEQLSGDLLTTARCDGHRLIAGALLRAAALDLRVTGVDLRTTSIGGGKVKGHGGFVFEPAQSARLGATERSYLLKAAAESLQMTAVGIEQVTRPFATGRLPMTLSALRAVTITLEQDRALRGRAGGVKPFRTLLTDVISRAAQAATDPRFPPIRVTDLQDMTLTIDIASNLRSLPASSQDAAIAALLPGRDGLVFEDKGRQAIAYPSAWRNIPDPKLFLTALKQQAGFEANHWSSTVQVSRFMTESFSTPLRAHLLA